MEHLNQLSTEERMTREATDLEYDIALSFAGEQRQIVEELAGRLTDRCVRVFYDDYEKADLWGKDLYQHFQTVYRDLARYCVIFVSSAHAAKIWPRHELKQAQARALRENQEYILPVRVDDTELPGLNATTGYIDLRRHTAEELAQLILQKLFGRIPEYDESELNWQGEQVEFRGTLVASSWPARLKRAQLKTTYSVQVPRIPYGRELSNRHASAAPCHDCLAVDGEYHDPGCDMEECPLCHGRAISCGCRCE